MGVFILSSKQTYTNTQGDKRMNDLLHTFLRECCNDDITLCSAELGIEKKELIKLLDAIHDITLSSQTMEIIIPRLKPYIQKRNEEEEENHG